MAKSLSLHLGRTSAHLIFPIVRKVNALVAESFDQNSVDLFPPVVGEVDQARFDGRLQAKTILLWEGKHVTFKLFDRF